MPSESLSAPTGKYVETLGFVLMHTRICFVVNIPVVDFTIGRIVPELPIPEGFMTMGLPHPHDGKLRLNAIDVVEHAAALAALSIHPFEVFVKKGKMQVLWDHPDEDGRNFVRDRYEFSKLLLKKFEQDNIDYATIITQAVEGLL